LLDCTGNCGVAVHRENSSPFVIANNDVSTPTPDFESESGQDVPPRIRLAPGRNQKQRSKLKQVEDPTLPEKADAASAPVQPTPVPESPRRVKLKRSGQMHADLTGPMPEDESKNEPLY
jgi:hypothetical protein